jgi:hypothetical protein
MRVQASDTMATKLRNGAVNLSTLCSCDHARFEMEYPSYTWSTAPTRGATVAFPTKFDSLISGKMVFTKTGVRACQGVRRYLVPCEHLFLWRSTPNNHGGCSTNFSDDGG